MGGGCSVVLDAKLFRFNGTGRREGRPMRFIEGTSHPPQIKSRREGGRSGMEVKRRVN